MTFVSPYHTGRVFKQIYQAIYQLIFRTLITIQRKRSNCMNWRKEIQVQQKGEGCQYNRRERDTSTIKVESLRVGLSCQGEDPL